MMLEKEIESAVKRYAESKGWITRKWTSPNHAFVPDQIFISPTGKVIFIEFKRAGQKPTAGQEAGWKVFPCNRLGSKLPRVDYDYYQQEIEKLTLGVM